MSSTRHRPDARTAVADNQIMSDTMPFDFSDSGLRFDAATRTYHHQDEPKLSARRIHDMILTAAARQVATASAAQAIEAAGLGSQLWDLITQISANAANPIADAIELESTSVPVL